MPRHLHRDEPVHLCFVGERLHVDAAAVDDADLLGTEALASFAFGDDDETRKIGYIGNKRYTRLTITPSANASAALVAAVAILGHPQIVPTPNPPV